MPATTSLLRRAALLATLVILPAACTSSPGPASPATAPVALRPATGFEPLIAQALTAETIAQRSLAILATTQDDTSENLVKTAAAIRQAQAAVAQSLCNAHTPGYKALRPCVADGRALMQLDMEPGVMENTNRDFDVAITGKGFLRVKVEDKTGEHCGYTRNGNLFVDRDGNLVVGLGDGCRLDPGICVPQGVTSIVITEDGCVEVLKVGSVRRTMIGQIKLWQFLSPQSLSPLTGSIYAETALSGAPTESSPGADGAGKLLQGFLEQSNVDLTRERQRLDRLKEWQDGIDQALRLTARPAGR